MMRFIPFIHVILKVDIPSNVCNVQTDISDDEIYSIYSCYFEGGSP